MNTSHVWLKPAQLRVGDVIIPDVRAYSFKSIKVRVVAVKKVRDYRGTRYYVRWERPEGLDPNYYRNSCYFWPRNSVRVYGREGESC